MSKIVNIEINEETSNYIQSISMEVNSRLSLLNSIGTSLGVKSQTFKDYEKEYIKFDMEYQLIKNALEEIYIPAALRRHELKWNLNFQTNLLEIEVLCSCGIALVNSGKLDFTPNLEKDDIVERFSNKDEDEE